MNVRSIAFAALGLAAIADQAADAQRRAMLTIKSLESDKPQVTAQYNPKELGIDKAVSWATVPGSTEDDPAVRYLGPEPRMLKVDLTFDHRTDVRPIVAPLEDLARVDEALKRPPLVQVDWNSGTASSFQGVIESVGTKYTIFLPDGTPVRARVYLRVLEARRVSTQPQAP